MELKLGARTAGTRPVSLWIIEGAGPVPKGDVWYELPSGPEMAGKMPPPP